MTVFSMTLEQKLRSLMFRDEQGAGPFSKVSDLPGQGELTEREMDLRDWGIAYGIAFGLARTEEPCEQDHAVAQRAYNAALPVYREWGGDIAPRAIFEEVA